MFKILRTKTSQNSESTTVRYISENNKDAAVAMGHSAK